MNRTLLITALACCSLALGAPAVRVVATPKAGTPTQYRVVGPDQKTTVYSRNMTLNVASGSQICVQKGVLRYDLFVDGKKKMSKTIFPASGCEKLWAPSPSFTEAVSNYVAGLTRFFLPADDEMTVAGSSKSLTPTSCYQLSTDIVLPKKYPLDRVALPVQGSSHALVRLELKDAAGKTVVRQLVGKDDPAPEVFLDEFKRSFKYEVYDASNFQNRLLFEGRTIFGDWQDLDLDNLNLQETMNWLLESHIQPFKVAVYNFLLPMSASQPHEVAQQLEQEIREAYFAYDADVAFECNNLLDEIQGK